MKKGVIKNKSFRINQEVLRWVKADQPDDDSEAADKHFERWYEPREKGQGVVEMGPYVCVDQAVFRARFSCVPSMCAPGSGQGKWRCCCANIHVPLTVSEKRKLNQASDRFSAFLSKKEPRLIRVVSGSNGNGLKYWLDEDGTALSQPNGRCVFSAWDRMGRIRCHLHEFAKLENMSLNDVQPYTCRIFPLLVIQMERSRILVTVLNKENYRAWETLAPGYFPCLSDPSHPPILRSMAKTFDWLFGEGFSKELARRGKLLGLYHR